MRRLQTHLAEPPTCLNAEYATYVLVTHKPFALTPDDRVYGRSVTVLISARCFVFQRRSYVRFAGSPHSSCSIEF